MESDALTGTFSGWLRCDIIIKILHQVCSLSMYQSNPFILARPWALPLQPGPGQCQWTWRI